MDNQGVNSTSQRSERERSQSMIISKTMASSTLNRFYLENRRLSIARSHDRFLPFQCDPAVGMKSFFDMVHSHPKKLALFGAACNAVTDPIAKASQFFELVQVSVSVRF